MSVITITHLRGDVAKMKATLEAGADTLSKVTEQANQVGALSHRFAEGDGELLAVDVWTSAEEPR